ncbi:MAG TPA: hypothetical protein VL971_10410, partial [Rhizomicrobium sp.]|nr:hypothetical protein [Rhizomicrobium sp.]
MIIKRNILLGTAAIMLLAGPALGQSTTTAPAKKHHHHHVATASASSVDARIDQLEQEIHELKAEEAAAQAAPPPPPDAVSQAQFEALQNQVYEQQAATTSMTKSSWWANTKISGRFYWDISDVSATGNVKSAAASLYHTKSPQDGFNYDLKRAYLMVD